ncbi:MAG: hypothetical protein NTV46_20480 [Verrucomicrobia bacterium]|nr:hypothetical protein [Verrucomicrobiota bacterium]
MREDFAGRQLSERVSQALTATGEAYWRIVVRGTHPDTPGRWVISLRPLAPGMAQELEGNPSFTLTLTAAANGGITGNANPYLYHANASLTATPIPGYLFTGWTGDATGAANPLSVLMDSDKTVSATFTPDTNDDDDDGWTNYQEIVLYNTNPTLWDTDEDGVKDSQDAFPLDPAETLDTDKDGFLDGYEVLTGKSPLDIADHPALVAEARTAIEFTFPAASGKT